MRLRATEESWLAFDVGNQPLLHFQPYQTQASWRLEHFFTWKLLYHRYQYVHQAGSLALKSLAMDEVANECHQSHSCGSLATPGAWLIGQDERNPPRAYHSTQWIVVTYWSPRLKSKHRRERKRPQMIQSQYRVRLDQSRLRLYRSYLQGFRIMGPIWRRSRVHQPQVDDRLVVLK